MPRFLFLTLALLTFGTQAAPSFDCSDLKAARLRLSVHTANLLNASTTRTPEGGPFERRILVGSGNGDFQIQSKKEFKLVFEPGHPDADAKGMVSFPNIDIEKERQFLHSSLQELQLLTTKGVCHSTAIQNKDSFLTKYSDKDSDLFTFSEAGKLATWTHYSRTGEVHTDIF